MTRQSGATALDHAAAADAYGRTLLGQVDRKYLTHPAARIAIVIGLGAALIVPSIQAVVKIQKASRGSWRMADTRRSALGRWLSDAKALTAGQDPYGAGHWFPNPPIVLMALVPLSKLSPTAAAAIWAAAKIAAAVAAAWMAVDAMRRAGYFVPFGVMVMTAVFGTKPIIADLQHGNINIFVLLEVAAVWWLFVRGRDAWAGVVLGLAIATKVTPALLLVYFLYKRCWKLSAMTVVGLAVFAIVLPGVSLGFERNATLLKSWFDMLIAPSLLHGYVTIEVANQSLPGVLTRWMHAAGAAMESLSTTQSIEFGMEGMERPAAVIGRAVIKAVVAAVLLSLVWLCRGRARDRRRIELWFEFALVLLAMLLLSERTWKHHLTTLLLIYLPVWQVLTCRDWSDKFRAWFVGGLVAQWVLLTGAGGLDAVFGDAAEDAMLGVGTVCFGLVLCFVQTAIMLRRARTSSQPA